jgi:hypothetical protein
MLQRGVRCYDDPDPLGISLVFAIANSEYSDEDD